MLYRLYRADRMLFNVNLKVTGTLLCILLNTVSWHQRNIFHSFESSDIAHPLNMDSVD